jgi:hypothetical protein
MALTVEDGTCVVAANAFVTRNDLIAYATDYYPDVDVPDDESTDAAIMRGSQWLSTYPIWDGTMTCGRGLQGLAWPRAGVTDCNGDSVPDDEVPVEIQQATYIAALAEHASPGVLTPTVTPGSQVKRVKVDVIEQEFMTPAQQGMVGKTDPVSAMRPVLTAVTDLIKCMATVPDGKTVPWPWVA